ncbi:MAG: hypothetical protein EHM22_02725, partial [Actinobacteria bacterium]
RAKARLDSLNQELSLMVEQYNQAQLRLQEVQARLADVRAEAQTAQATADRATTRLNSSAARAYQGMGSQIALLFDSASMADFSDRLEFIGSMAQADSDLALDAELARQDARWTADELAATAEERQGIVDELAAKQDQIEERVAEARDLFETLDRQYHEALQAQAAAEAAAAGSTGVDTSPIPPPPAPNPNVATVLQAAYSVIGTPYQYGGTSPETGFDCSGFTMWAWAHAGVYLPHSSASQYAVAPTRRPVGPAGRRPPLLLQPNLARRDVRRGRSDDPLAADGQRRVGRLGLLGQLRGRRTARLIPRSA